jgi:hypothetical protein
MTDELATNSWQARAAEYRQEPPIAKALDSAKKIKIDMSILDELQQYFPHMEEADKLVKRIHGPADLQKGMEIAEQIKSYKDRTSYLLLTLNPVKGRLERLLSIVRAQLFLKKEVLNLKNDTQRNAVISITCPEIEEKLDRVSRLVDAAHLVNQNINQSFNILRTQVEIVKEMMYEGGLSNVGRKSKQTLADKV